MSSALLERITVEPGKCGGRPCIRGTRMRVSDVLELLANGASTEEVLSDHSSLVRDDVLAAIAYAAVHMSHGRFPPTSCTTSPSADEHREDEPVPRTSHNSAR